MFDISRLKYLYSLIVLVLLALLQLSFLYEGALDESDQHALSAQAELLSVRFAAELRAGSYRMVSDAFGTDSPNMALEVLRADGRSVFRSRDFFTAVRCAQSSLIDGQLRLQLCRVDGPYQSFLSEIRKRAQLLMTLAILIVAAAILLFNRVVRKAVQSAVNDIAAVIGREKVVDGAPLPGLLGILKSHKKSIEDYQEVIAKKARFAAIGEVAAQFQHDMSNPIHILEVVVNAKSPTVQLQDAAKRAVLRIRQMVDEVGNFSGSLRVTLAPTRVRDVIDEAVGEFQLRRPDILVEVALLDGVVANLDRLAVIRVMGNLMNNAVEAKSPKVRITGEVSATSGRMEIKVHDWGVGIDPAMQHKVMYAFATYGKANGTGLGLWHASRVMEAMGGRLDVASPGELGAATTVTLSLPI